MGGNGGVCGGPGVRWVGIGNVEGRAWRMAGPRHQIKILWVRKLSIRRQQIQIVQAIEPFNVKGQRGEGEGEGEGKGAR